MRRRGIYRVGAVWTPIIETAGDILDAVSKFAEEIGIGKVTGPLLEALEDFWKGPFRDFARQPYGKTAIRAFALMYNQAQATEAIVGAGAALATIPGFQPAAVIAKALAPLLATTGQVVSIAAPGIARGEAPAEAFVKEGAWRIAETIRYFSKDAADAINSKVQGAFDEVAPYAYKVAGELGQEAFARLSVRELAAKLGLSDRALALQIRAWISGRADDLQAWADYQHASDFDLSTGTSAKMDAEALLGSDMLGDESPQEQRERLEREQRARQLRAMMGHSVALSPDAAAAMGVSTFATTAQATSVALPGGVAVVKAAGKDAAASPSEGSERNSTASTVAVAVLVVVAGVALWRWYVWQQEQAPQHRRAA